MQENEKSAESADFTPLGAQVDFLACISNENGALFEPFLLKVAFGRKSAFFSKKGGKGRFSHFWAEKCAFPRKGWNFVSIRWDHLAVDENYCLLPDPPSRVGRRPLRQPFSSFSSSPRIPFQRVRWGLASPLHSNNTECAVKTRFSSMHCNMIFQ